MKRIIAKMILFICFIGVLYSLYNIVKWKMNVQENSKIKKQIDNHIKDLKKYDIDFRSLKKKNSDVVAYLEVKGTNISYVVVRGSDNRYYLNHNFDKKVNIAGWIFADYHNKFDETDSNIVIFGHNTRDGSMFGSLQNVLDKNWYKNKKNHKVVLVTEQGVYYYKVFSSYSIVPEEYYITTSFENSDAYSKFLNELKVRSIYDYGEEVTVDDKILTLSSCIGDGKKRVVVHAKLMEKRDS